MRRPVMTAMLPRSHRTNGWAMAASSVDNDHLRAGRDRERPTIRQREYELEGTADLDRQGAARQVARGAANITRAALGVHDPVPAIGPQYGGAWKSGV